MTAFSSYTMILQFVIKPQIIAVIISLEHINRFDWSYNREVIGIEGA